MRITDPGGVGPAAAESTRRDGPTPLDVVVDGGFGNEGRWRRSTARVAGDPCRGA